MARRLLALSSLILTACSGDILVPARPGLSGGIGGLGFWGGSGSGNGGAGGGAGGGDVLPIVDPCGPTASPGSAPMRRLSHEEYRNSLGDVLPASTATAIASGTSGFLEDPVSLSFRNNANFLDVKPVLAQQYLEAAEGVAAAASADLPHLLPCTPTASTEATCADQFIRAFGRRLYRHVLAEDEVAPLKAIYASARASYDFKSGIEFVIAGMLQSPRFLYRLELDQASSPAVRPLTGAELASRLSYLLWHSAPDDALLAAAERGDLSQPADVEREARRLLADPKAKRLFSFFEQWMHLDELSSGLRRDATTFPGLDPNLAALFRTETQAFVGSVLWDGDGTLNSLLTAPQTFVNDALASHYGLPAVTGAAFQRVTFPTARGGLLMQGGVLAVHDKPTRTSIVRRGLRVRTDVLCQVVNAPPPNVNADLGPVDQGLSQADRLAQHRTNLACSGCHNLMDPIGVAFESIDAVGRNRTGFPTSGDLVSAGDASGSFSDGNALVSKLASSTLVRDCFAQQLYRFSMGRKEEAADACSRSRLRARFATTGGDMRDLLIALTQSDDFLYRAVTAP